MNWVLVKGPNIKGGVFGEGDSYTIETLDDVSHQPDGSLWIRTAGTERRPSRDITYMPGQVTHYIVGEVKQ